MFEDLQLAGGLPVF